MSPWRLYLLAGLVAHKLVWEVLKRRDRPPAAGRTPNTARLLKAVKTAILAGLVVQTLLPELFPIMTDPQPLRVIGIALYTVGLAVALLARVQLGANWSDIEAPQILQRQTVVDRGIYRYIRHPIYTGDLLLLCGFELALNSWLVLGLVAMLPYVVRQALREEQLLARTLPGYAAYCARTKRLIPFLV